MFEHLGFEFVRVRFRASGSTWGRGGPRRGRAGIGVRLNYSGTTKTRSREGVEQALEYDLIGLSL